MKSGFSQEPWADQANTQPTPAFQRYMALPEGQQVARSVLAQIRVFEWSGASPAEILAAARQQLENIASDKAGQFMREYAEWEARQ